MTDAALVDHLVDDVPLLDSETIKVLESVLDVFEHRLAELGAGESQEPAGVVLGLGP